MPGDGGCGGQVIVHRPCRLRRLEGRGSRPRRSCPARGGQQKRGLRGEVFHGERAFALERSWLKRTCVGESPRPVRGSFAVEPSLAKERSSERARAWILVRRKVVFGFRLKRDRCRGRCAPKASFRAGRSESGGGSVVSLRQSACRDRRAQGVSRLRRCGCLLAAALACIRGRCETRGSVGSETRRNREPPPRRSRSKRGAIESPALPWPNW
jgi:hypothetical protein